MLADGNMAPYFQIRTTSDVDEQISRPATVELVAPDGQFYFLDLTYIFDPAFEMDDSFVLPIAELFDVCADFSGGEVQPGDYVSRSFIGGETAGEYPFTLEE